MLAVFASPAGELSAANAGGAEIINKINKKNTAFIVFFPDLFTKKIVLMLFKRNVTRFKRNVTRFKRNVTRFKRNVTRFKRNVTRFKRNVTG
ncbi:MAG: hypothetical protein PHH67_09740 [Methanosarcina sp.]|jgi:hypothetical protein|nr:hypothetical protein [Methanosarcina sp.]MDD3318016.1 hypothetical protein [Methanosarcina sp.]MDD4306765.1 hypothetical protein [Methanosarcina sp.]MDD4621289.1 hypothetical protein [Methanosarcina sp.]